MRFRSAMILTAALAAAACSGDKGGRKTDADSTAVKKPVVFDALKRPVGPIKRDEKFDYVVKVQGNNQLRRSELIMSPPSFPSKFSTYKGDDMQMASMMRDGIATLSLSPIFGSQPDPDAFVQIIFDTMSVPATNAADSTLHMLTAGRKVTGISGSHADSTAWATDAKTYQFTADGKKLQSTVIVGRRGKNTYRIFAQYPASRADVLRARLHEILTQWRWEDDYSYLVPAPAVPASADTAPPAAAPKPASKK